MYTSRDWLSCSRGDPRVFPVSKPETVAPFAPSPLKLLKPLKLFPLKICKSANFVVPLHVNYDLSYQMNEFLEREEQVLRMIKTVYDPEIPVNIYELGLIYRIDLPGDGVCNIDMTLTAPNCPAADFLVEDVKQKVGSVDGINEVNVNIVFEPEWNKDMMSEEAKLELGFL